MMGTFKITVNSATSYERGTCADITVGAKLRVTGTTQTDGSILASAIEVKESHDDGPGERVEGEGIITGLKTGTSCPTLTFFVESKQVDVTAATVFERGTCADLAIGKRVHVKGTSAG